MKSAVGQNRFAVLQCDFPTRDRSDLLSIRRCSQHAFSIHLRQSQTGLRVPRISRTQKSPFEVAAEPSSQSVARRSDSLHSCFCSFSLSVVLLYCCLRVFFTVLLANSVIESSCLCQSCLSSLAFSGSELARSFDSARSVFKS